MDRGLTFGDYLRGKRKDTGITMREVAEVLEVSTPYYCDIEFDRRNPPVLDKLERLVQLFRLTPSERDTMYDLAGLARKEVAPDIAPYMLQNAYVGMALRKARDLNADEDDWARFVRELEERSGKKEK